MLVQSQKKIPFLSRESQNRVYRNCEKTRYPEKNFAICKILIVLGLRASECVTLKWGYFDFQNKELTITSLKTKGKRQRTIPLTTDVVEAVANYYAIAKSRESDDYLFPTNSASGHMTRQSLWRKVKKISDGEAYTHMMRHTAATNLLAEGQDLHTIKAVLGHKSIQTTEIYTHVDLDKIKLAMESVMKESLLVRLRRRWFPNTKVHLLPDTREGEKYFVGRKAELRLVNDLIDKRVNIFLQGRQGTGKSAILEAVTYEKVLRIDEFSGVKKTLGAMLLYLKEGEKAAVIDLITKSSDLSKYIVKESTKVLTDVLIDITEPKEYSIIIDDGSAITPSAVRTLERLKEHFHIIIGARQMKMNNIALLSDFEKVELKCLSRAETVKLIEIAAQKDLKRIENFEVYKSHIWDNAAGNPKFTLEMIKRLSVEKSITIEAVKNLRHTTALQEIDMSLVLLVFLGGLMVLRYYGKEVGGGTEGAFALFGGIFMIVALFGRQLFQVARRKYV